jgi:hypothetical protein
MLCAGQCVDVQSDPNNCGTCVNACPKSQPYCVGGACRVCPDSQQLCGGACVDPTSDRANCGACGATCTATQACVNSQCHDCPSGQQLCGNLCVDLTSDANNCGLCGTKCGRSQGHWACCRGACTSLDISDQDCGACGHVCPSSASQCCGGSCCFGGSCCVGTNTDGTNYYNCCGLSSANQTVACCLCPGLGMCVPGHYCPDMVCSPLGTSACPDSC